MMDLQRAWQAALPKVKQGVTGRTVWRALDAVVPIVIEQDVVVLGVPAMESTMIGHLKATATKRAIELSLEQVLGQPVTTEIIAGDTLADWEMVKTKALHLRDVQERGFQRSALAKERQRAWESSYEQLSRLNARVSNKALPQNRARLLQDGVQVIVEALREQGELDDLGERNLARLVERLASYTEVPSPLVALLVLQAMER